MSAWKDALKGHMNNLMCTHSGTLTYEEIVDNVGYQFGRVKSTTLRDAWKDTPSPKDWTPSTFLFFKQELQTRRDPWAARSGEVSLGEERQLNEQKLPSWFLTDLSDAETNKQLNEYWVSIEDIPLGYRTSDLAQLLSNTPLCIDIGDSFEERSGYRIRLG